MRTTIVVSRTFVTANDKMDKSEVIFNNYTSIKKKRKSFSVLRLQKTTRNKT